jgi:hypothetical protein
MIGLRAEASGANASSPARTISTAKVAPRPLVDTDRRPLVPKAWSWRSAEGMVRG